MAFNQFTNLDFADLRAQIKDYLRVNSNFTDFDFEGSNFSVLIHTSRPIIPTWPSMNASLIVQL